MLLVVGYPDIYQCADHVPEVMEHKPIGLEGFDDRLVGYTRKKGINSGGLALLPEGAGWLMVEFGASTRREAESQARGLMDSGADVLDIGHEAGVDHIGLITPKVEAGQ